MTPPEDPANAARERRRSYHACLTCRRKKTRCPGEKPACSSCLRLKQSCSYPPAARAPRNGRSEERLAHLEEKLDRLLNGNISNQPSREQAVEELANISEKSYSVSPPAPEGNYTTSQPVTALFDLENAHLKPGPADIAIGISLYFDFCHRQPIWCFEREDVSDYNSIPEELACSLLALTARFSPKQDQLRLYGNNARHLIMLRIANGAVDIETIESLCLLSYSSFIDGHIQLGQFHLGLAFQLCRSALMDLEEVYAVEDRATERKKKLFWSLQILEQYYGRQTGLQSVPTEIWKAPYTASLPRTHKLQDPADMPPLPRDDFGHTAPIPNEPGIWTTSVHLGWVWSRVRKYVSDCAQGIFKEPWRRDSMYAEVLSDFMETENRIPMCHRYDSVKFYERKVEELKMNREYWATWLKEQFTYHAIHTVLNHPFLYIIGAQHNPNLAIPNTFWRRSSELALLHSTWIVRIIDMVLDKQVQLVDPFFGHVAAIAATVHLYYCCAAAARLKHKSNTDFAKCRRFLKGFLPFSSACVALDRNLDQMTRIAAGSESVDVEDWMPSRIYLSIPLLWDILQFNCEVDGKKAASAGLLKQSLDKESVRRYADDDSTLEIIVATSPEIVINTADGGQEAPTLSYKTSFSPSSNPERNTTTNQMPLAQADILTFNTTPWLYEDPSFVNIGGMDYQHTDTNDDNRGMAWWEGDMSTPMFNSI